MPNKRWGFINTKGILLIPLQFDLALLFHEGTGMVASLLQD